MLSFWCTFVAKLRFFLESVHAFNLLHFWRKIAISESVQAHSWRQIVISESVQAFIFALKLNILVHIKHLVREEAEEWLNTLPTMISSWSWAVHSIFPTFCFHLHTKYSTPGYERKPSDGSSIYWQFYSVLEIVRISFHTDSIAYFHFSSTKFFFIYLYISANRFRVVDEEGHSKSTGSRSASRGLSVGSSLGLKDLQLCIFLMKLILHNFMKNLKCATFCKSISSKTKKVSNFFQKFSSRFFLRIWSRKMLKYVNQKGRGGLLRKADSLDPGKDKGTPHPSTATP